MDNDAGGGAHTTGMVVSYLAGYLALLCVLWTILAPWSLARFCVFITPKSAYINDPGVLK